MSKIYAKYLELKHNDSEKLYLFHSGKFYIFIAEDADVINQYVVLKKTKFTKEICKCGFPDNCLEDYQRVFKNHGLNIEIVESNLIEVPSIQDNKIIIDKYYKLEKHLKNINVNKIPLVNSIDLLNDLVKIIYE